MAAAAFQAAKPAKSEGPAWCGAIRERNLVRMGGSWQTEWEHR